MCFSRSYSKSSLRVHVFMCSEFKKNHTNVLLPYFSLSLLGFLRVSVAYMPTPRACRGSRYIVKGWITDSHSLLLLYCPMEIAMELDARVWVCFKW